MEFSTLAELYIRVTPALTTKANEFKKDRIVINNEDIWNCLKDTKWSKSRDLTLADIVNDILNVSSIDVLTYLNER